MRQAVLDRAACAAGAAPQRRTAVELLPLLMLSALPLLLWLFDGSYLTLAAALLHFALLVIAALLIAQGHAAHLAYDAAEATPRPALPRKLIGSVLLGLMVFLLAASRFTELLPTVFLGLAATGFSIAAFGPDPLRHKGIDDPAYIAAQASTALLTRTDAALRDTVDRVAALGDAALLRRTEAMHGATMRLLRAFNSDPTRMLALEKPLARFVSLTEAEVARLEADWRAMPERAATAYATRLEALTTAFETGARQRRRRETPDEYALDADLLLERMRSEGAG